MKNIFLTGDRNIGKSTIIYKVKNMLKEEGLGFCGFETLPYTENGKLVGFYIESVKNPGSKGTVFKRMIGKCIGYRKAIGFTETFEEIGVKILEESLGRQNDIIIMDELGILEKDALCFQRLVKDALSSKQIVLGVIKLKSSPFLDSIRNRKDVEVLEVNMQNRSDLPLEIYKKLKKILKKGK